MSMKESNLMKLLCNQKWGKTSLIVQKVANIAGTYMLAENGV